jgi:hypothetical protein
MCCKNSQELLEGGTDKRRNASELKSNYLLTYLLTSSMEQSNSWEPNRFSASQEIPHILRYTKVHYRIRKCVNKWLAYRKSMH